MFIDVAGLCKSYTTDTVVTEVLQGLDLKLNKGEIGVILGPSGSGKTTLMNIIGGVDRADSGVVLVNETEVTALDDEQLPVHSFRAQTLPGRADERQRTKNRN